MCLPHSIPPSRAELHKFVSMQLSEKSESASLCLQGLGAAGIPSFLISLSCLFIPFLQGVMSTWHFSSRCELHLLTLQADLQHADVTGGMPDPNEKLGHGRHEDSSIGLSRLPSVPCSCLSSQPGAWSEVTLSALTLPSWLTTFQQCEVVVTCSLGTWNSLRQLQSVA